jgi:5-methylcytosine-specific restriction endonuclease McrA
MDIITRKAAKLAGLKYYFTGKLCKRGHIDKRFVSSFWCMTCGREKATEWFRRLEGDKREARRDYERRRWQTPAFKNRQREYARQDEERIKKSIRNKAWKQANRASCTDRQNARHASYRTAFVEEVTLDYLFQRDKGLCKLCGDKLNMATKWPHAKTATRDHIIPLSKGGTHERNNLQLACAKCNIAKQNRSQGEQMLLIG